MALNSNAQPPIEPGTTPPAQPADDRPSPTSASGDQPLATPTTPRQPALQVAPPAGFEDLETRVDSLFDVTFQGRRIGSFRAVVEAGSIRFVEPQLVVAALGETVIAEDALALLSRPLPINEDLVCAPGQFENCGFLPPGASGVLVNIATFSAELFLARQLLAERVGQVRELGPPPGGFSFIQNALVSISATTAEGSDLRYGGTFDTFASVGRTAFIAQTTLETERGLGLQFGYVQHTTNDFVAAAGLFTNFNTLILNPYQLAGAQFGSNDRLLLTGGSEFAAPIEVVLPRAAIVEIYRGGVLLSTRRYEAGLQLLDTVNLPAGSYPIEIIARDGGAVVLQETRTLVKVADIPPPGRTLYQVSAGLYVQDQFTEFLAGDSDNFLPRVSDDPLISARVARRIGPAIGATGQVIFVGSELYAEAGLSTYFGAARLSGAVTAGTNGAYGVQVNVSATILDIAFNLSARSNRLPPELDETVGPARFRSYLPFFRSEDGLVGSAQFSLLGGSASISGSYSRSEALPDRYTLGARYTRPFRLGRFADALFNVYTSVSNVDSRAGITISFLRRLNRRTIAAVEAGAEYADGSGAQREGFYPVVRGTVTRRDRLGPVDLINQFGLSTDSNGERAFADVTAGSTLGEASLGAQVEHDRFGRTFGSFTFNGQTGIAFGQGAFKFGLRQPGESMLFIDIQREAEARAVSGAAGGYRLLVDGQPYDFIRPGQLVAVGLPSLETYRISLRPEDAPPFEIDLAERAVSLYPGNVVRLRWNAQRSYTLFGQIAGADGVPIPAARVRAGGDLSVADDNGYFTVSGAADSTIEVRRADGTICLTTTIRDLGSTAGRNITRVGTLRCAAN